MTLGQLATKVMVIVYMLLLHIIVCRLAILPKININSFSIGIGGGVKIPLSAQIYSKTTFEGKTFKQKYNYNTKGLTSTDDGLGLSPAVIGYIKATFDYSFFFTDNMAMNLGLCLGYDFMPTKKAYDHNYNGTGVYKNQEGTFDIGVQLGFKFGSKA